MSFPPIPLEYVKQHAAGQLSIDCPRAELARDDAANEPRLSGPAAIRSSDSGAFAVTMFPRDVDETHALKLAFGSFGRIAPGKVLPPEAYYTLAATDVCGRTWRTRVAHPSASVGEGGLVITGTASSLECTHGKETIGSGAVVMHFDGPLDLQWNAITQTTVDVGDGQPRRSIARNRAAMDIGQLRIEADEANEGISTVRARSECTEFDRLESRVLEALRFITLRPVTWIALDRQAATGRTWALQAKRSAQRSFLQPPLGTADGTYWNLFERYLLYVLAHDDPDSFHPLTTALNPVIFSGGATIEAIALSLGVTVEGVLKVVRSLNASVAPDVLEGVKKLEHVISSVTDVAPNVIDRALGSISGLKAVRPGDQLSLLVARGVLSPGHVSAWKSLRNSSAHASLNAFDDLDKSLDRCHTVYELLLRLVYLEIGYQGPFRRYAEPNWPLSANNWPPP